MTRALFALKLRLLRNGPHNERAFSLVTGLILAALVIAGASLTTHGVIHEGWIAVALTVWGGMWLFGPLAQPRHDPSVISREWWRGYPLRSWRLARALSWTELLGIGPLITLACLSSLVVLAAPGGTAAVTAAIAAALAQLYLLIWGGKTVAALAGWLLQTRVGVTLAASYLADLLRSRERLVVFGVTRVRRLVSRVRADLDELTDEDRAQIQQAVQVVRRTRQVGSLGLPRVRQPLPDLRRTRSPDMSKGPFNLT
ncbi:hypothetical protein [Streptomyces sp. ME01-18h]|uniref:hypothetical protein n=1 Tax=Streptomyces sp. ME01-18h TaxID=462920 RepID=UPI0029A0DC12|nr:hypothetical protein [Streptomyces sp. ME01-18h]MDX3396989.1 hypothetical protein [Streptomyces sp. ME01-18h]